MSRTSTHEVRLAVRRPYHAAGMLDFLAAHVVPGLEVVRDGTFARVLRLPNGPGVVASSITAEGVVCRFELTDSQDTDVAVESVRRLLDLDVDPVAIDGVLGSDPALAPLVRDAAGLRVAGSFDGHETAVRTVAGQQVSVAGAQTVIARLVHGLGEPVDLALAREHGLTHAFPAPESLAEADAALFSMPTSRAATIRAVSTAVADGAIDLGHHADRAAARAGLLALKGVGPWTADYVVMRALRDPDVLLETDLVLRRELAARGITPSDAERWRPWRSYAGMHLWRASAAFERIP